MTLSPPTSVSWTWTSIFRYACVAGLGAFLLYFYQRGDLDQETLKQAGAALPTWLFVVAWLILPLLGFPISVVLLATGMKLSLEMAMAMTVIGMGVHTFSAWHIAHGCLRQRLQSLLKTSRFSLPRIPKKHQVWFTAMFVTVPGLPYAVKLYGLALTDLPFRRYMAIVWSFHVLNSVPFIGLGSAAINFNVAWLLVFGLLAIATIALTNWLKQWLLSEESLT